MTSVQGNSETKYAFSLLSHNRTKKDIATINNFELSEEEIMQASDILELLKSFRKR